MLDAIRHLSAWHPDTSFYLFYSLSINVFFGFQTLKFHSRQKNQSCLASVPLNLVQHMHLLPHVPIHTHITFKVGLKRNYDRLFTGRDLILFIRNWLDHCRFLIVIVSCGCQTPGGKWGKALLFCPHVNEQVIRKVLSLWFVIKD